MSAQLVHEVLRHAPRELTPSERMVLVVIAEDADEKTRTCSPGLEVFTQGTGLGERRIRYVFQQLAARGYEVRVPVGNDSKGRPIFAKRGHRTEYRLPKLRPQEEELGGTPVPPNSGS